MAGENARLGLIARAPPERKMTSMLQTKTYLPPILLLATFATFTACSQQKPQQAAQPAQPAAAPAAAQPPTAPAATQPAPAAASPLQTQDTDTSGLVADLMECKRHEGVLTIKVRFRNASSSSASHKLYESREYDQYYFTAANKKYFILKDSENTYLATQASGGGYLNADLHPGGTFQWWAKYPAPPPDVQKIQFIMPRVAPFDDVPITDQ
jgi:hypothetical protein